MLPSIVAQGIVIRTGTVAGEQNSPPREEGWTRPQEIIAKHPHLERTGSSLTEAFRCERPPRLRRLRWLRDFFFIGAATPPHEEGTLALLQAFGNSPNQGPGLLAPALWQQPPPRRQFG